MNIVRDFVLLLEKVDTAFLLLTLVILFALWVRGILPVIWRLGNGLARRKIALFAGGDSRVSLRSLLLDSRLIREKNLLYVTNEADLHIADDASVFLVYWPDWGANIDAILERKTDATALIVYAPTEYGRIPKDVMAGLDKKRNVVVVNFRGRLMNDIVTCLITTSYEKK